MSIPAHFSLFAAIAIFCSGGLAHAEQNSRLTHASNPSPANHGNVDHKSFKWDDWAIRADNGATLGTFQNLTASMTKVEGSANMLFSLNYHYVTGGYRRSSDSPYPSDTGFNIEFLDANGVVVYTIQCGITMQIRLELNCHDGDINTPIGLPNIISSVDSIRLVYRQGQHVRC